jgi:UDP-N-acetylmuramate--alanine ligase
MKKVHLIGIGGIGMSALARILMQQGVQVSGSDAKEGAVTVALRNLGAIVHIGHDARNVPTDAVVGYSSAVKKDNPEFEIARQRQQQLLHRSDLLREIIGRTPCIAITGTHGKTTTTALAAAVFSSKDPSWAVGGHLRPHGVNAQLGKGDLFIVEGDESDGSFLKIDPEAAIVTNLEGEHLDHYGSEAVLTAAFAEFFLKISDPDRLVWCGDDANLAALNPNGISYGIGEHCDCHVSDIRQEGWATLFSLQLAGRIFHNIEVALTGSHNALNAAAVFALALQYDIEEQEIRARLRHFGGVARRCQHKGASEGALVIDDYAHHPTEVQVTLAAIKKAVPERRLVAIFQPHKYSRTRDCLGLYGSAFAAADQVVITDIFAAGEAPIDGVDAHRVMREIQSESSYLPRQGLPERIRKSLRPGDVAVCLGAGDITQVAADLVS